MRMRQSGSEEPPRRDGEIEEGLESRLHGRLEASKELQGGAERSLQGEMRREQRVAYKGD